MPQSSVTTNIPLLAADDISGILSAMQRSQDEDGRGVLFFPRLGVSVSFDLVSGEVSHFKLVQEGDIRVIYQDKLVQQLEVRVTENVKEAIKLYSAVYLLEKFLELNDPIVTKIITSQHGGVIHA